ncbi:MAG: PDZ domain-containing protein [Phycisphaerales bacterium]|nr:PDZ domain-containing protein [Phycisphaerales bacterium]
MTHQRFSKALSLILLAGMIPAAAANAQFVNDDDHTTHVTIHADKNNGHDSVKWTQMVSTGDHLYDLEVKDGVYIVKVDRKQVPSSWIRDNGDTVEIIDDDGNEIFVFRDYPQLHMVRGEARFPRDVRTNGAFAFANREDGPKNIQGRVSINIEQPKVMLGINLSDPSDALSAQLGLGDREAILIDGVIDGLPAEKAGLKKYDVIVSINGSDEVSSESLQTEMMRLEPGDTMKLVIIRGGEKRTLKVELEAYDNKFFGGVRAVIRLEDKDDAQERWFNEDENDEHEVLRRILRERIAPTQSTQWRLLHSEMTEQARETMEKARAQAIELRDGQLFFGESRVRRNLESKSSELLKLIEGGEWQTLGEDAQNRLGTLEARLNTLEDQLEVQADRLEAQMMQLTGLLERMFEKLSRDDDE